MAMVLLPVAAYIDGDAVAEAFRLLAPDAPPLTARDDRNGNFTFEHDGDSFIAARMESPIPNGEAEANARYSLSALTSRTPFPPHAEHLVVAALGDGKPGIDAQLERLVPFTLLVAALAQTGRAIGVYWGPGHVTHPRDFFVDSVRTGPGGMLTVWTGVSMAREGQGVSLLTTGLSQFGVLELMVTSTQPGTALGRLFDLASYAVERGAAPADGDTIGASEQEKLTVRHVPSPSVPGTMVWRVEL